MNLKSTEFSNDKIIEIGLKALDDELISLKELPKYLNDDFANAVRTILRSKGRVVLTGIGKKCNNCTKNICNFK